MPTYSVILAAIGAWLLHAAPAQAQMYRCQVGGTTYLSDKPCPGPARPTEKLVYVGPTDDTSSSSSTYRSYRSSRPSSGTSLEKAPDYQRHLSGACASLSDAIRTAHGRGVSWQGVNDLRKEYDEKCEEQDRYARKLQYEEKKLSRAQQLSSYKAADQAREDKARLTAQCNALRDAIAAKSSKISTLTPGEQANFKTLQQSYNDRCVKAP